MSQHLPASSIVNTPSPGGTQTVLPGTRWWKRFLPAREGAFWVLLTLGIPRALGPIFTIGLRRFLGPDASGVFDMASTPYSLLDSVRNFGIGPALVYQPEINEEVANTAWTLNMLAAILVTILAQFLAGPAAIYYRHPEVASVLRVLSIAYVFASVSSVHMFLLVRDRNFRRRTIPAAGQVVAGGVVAIVLALWGFGVGALAAREIASAAAGAILLWAIYPFRPRLRLAPPIAWQLLRYGLWVGLGLMLLFMSQNVDVVVGGRIIHSSSDIGFYTTSWRLAFVAPGIFTVLFASLVFATLSRLQHDPEVLRRKLVVAIRLVGFTLFPTAALLALLAPILIVPLLGDKWAHYRASYAVLSLLAVYACNRTMLATFFEGYKAVGKPWIVPVYNAVKLCLMIPAMIVGAHHGILGLAMTYIPIQTVEIPVALWLAHHVLNISPGAIWHAVALPLGGTAGMAAGVVAVEWWLHSRHIGDFTALAICLPLAMALYLGIILRSNSHVLLEARATLLKGL